jgi:lipid-A-disaccharide synthase-like uncharacterized protein
MLIDLSNQLGGYLHNIFYQSFDFWVAFGALAQALFTLRFAVQLWASERAGKSVVPFSFWILSIAGGLGLFIYAVARRDPIFMVGQGAGVLIYMRNISFVLKENAAKKAAAEADKHN